MEKPKRTRPMSVAIGDEARRILEELATKRTSENGRTYASDLIREAVQEYLERRGYNITIEVDRGGYRERTDPTDE